MAVNDDELDQLRELTSVGAGHAASAFSQLTGRTIEMRPPVERSRRCTTSA